MTELTTPEPSSAGPPVPPSSHRPKPAVILAGQPPPKRWLSLPNLGRCAFLLWFAFMLFFCLMSGDPGPALRLPFDLTLGWILYLRDVLPRVTAEPAAIATAVLCLIFITAGVHGFARWLRREVVQAEWRFRSSVGLVALFVLAFVSGISAVGVAHQTTWLFTMPEPFFESSWNFDREISAIGSLKSVAVAQSMFREGDKEQDGLLDYATLDELSTATLVDPILGAGTKQGYLFEVCPSVTTPELLWFATALPTRPPSPNGRYDRFFFTNQSGVIFYTTSSVAPNVDRATCDMPKNMIPVGR